MTKITAIQTPVTRNALANSKNLTEVIEKEKGTDWLLTPEGALSGYCAPPVINTCNNDNAIWTSQQEGILLNLSQQHDMGLLLGTGWIEGDGVPYNQVRVYKVNYIGAYSKRLLPTTLQGGGEATAYIPGWAPMVFDVDDKHRAGVLICNDVWASPLVSPNGNPYYITEYAKMGVNILFVAVNCNVADNWDELYYTWHENHLRMFAKSFGMKIVISGSSLDMAGKIEVPVQCPNGIIDSNGEWIQKLKDTGSDSCTIEI